MLQDVTIIGCFAHVRQKFNDPLKSIPAESRDASSTAKGLDYCNRLFDLKRDFEGLPPEQKRQKCLEMILPIAEAFLAWANSFAGLTNSLTKKRRAIMLVNGCT